MTSAKVCQQNRSLFEYPALERNGPAVPHLCPFIEGSCLVRAETWKECCSVCQRLLLIILLTTGSLERRSEWHIPCCQRNAPIFSFGITAPQAKSDWWRLDHVPSQQGSLGEHMTDIFITKGGNSLLRCKSKQVRVKHVKHLAQCLVHHGHCTNGSCCPHWEHWECRKRWWKEMGSWVHLSWVQILFPAFRQDWTNAWTFQSLQSTCVKPPYRVVVRICVTV